MASNGGYRMVKDFQINPTKYYMICTSPRTGSELVCEYLSRTEKAGKPGEHFFPKRFPNFYEHYKINQFSDYFNIILRERTTPNGVFGTKMIAGEILNDFLSIIRKQRIALNQSLNDYQTLNFQFSNLSYIRLKREDRLRQAISFYRAESTGVWHDTGVQSSPVKIEFNRIAIQNYLDQINHIEYYWDQFFKQAQIIPLEITYESFVKDPIFEIHRIFDFLNLSIPQNWHPNLITNKKMASQETDRWVYQFLNP